MRYQSNLECPDLSPHFRLLDPPKQMMGHDAPSDPDFEPNCTFWTHDEATILYNVAKQVGGKWLDVGARFGWTAAHMVEAGCVVSLCDPLLRYAAQQGRMESNLDFFWASIGYVYARDYDWVIAPEAVGFDGVVIDGNHDRPYPLNDAISAHGMTQDDCVIIFHDYWGEPIQEAVGWLQDAGYKSRIYCTPNGVALCWRGLPGFVPPEHVPDPAIDWKRILSERVK